MKLICEFLFLAILSNCVMAKGLTFAIMAKSIDDSNFIDVWRGCNEAAMLYGDECVLLGGKGNAQLRVQAAEIRAAVKSQKFDAFAISVISSKLVARALKGVQVPVISFDSPFTREYQHLSQAYVGVDNLEFGKDLAKIAKHLLPQGGSICFMTAMHDKNLSLRVQGARLEFSDNYKLDASNRLNPKSKWTELNRCPWNTSDNIFRSYSQLQYTLKMMLPDILISVGSWPIVNMQKYREIVTPYYQDLSANNPFIIMGVGNHNDNDMKTLIELGLAHGFVSINFQEIGKKNYEIMRELVQGTGDNTIERENYIPTVIQVR